MLGRFLLLLSFASLAAARHSSAFIAPAPRCNTGVEECSIFPTSHRVRGVKQQTSRVKLNAAAKGASKKKKSVKKKSAAAEAPVETFKKPEFVASIAEKTGLTKAASEDALNAVLATISEQLADGKKVSLVGFGTFQAKERAARTGRNPRTGEPIDIPASKAPTFSAGKGLKDYVNGRE